MNNIQTRISPRVISIEQKQASLQSTTTYVCFQAKHLGDYQYYKIHIPLLKGTMLTVQVTSKHHQYTTTLSVS